MEDRITELQAEVDRLEGLVLSLGSLVLQWIAADPDYADRMGVA